MQIVREVMGAVFGLAFAGAIAGLVAHAAGAEVVTAVVAAVVAVLVSAYAMRGNRRERDEYQVRGVSEDGTIGFVWVTGRFEPLKASAAQSPSPVRSERDGVVVQSPPPSRGA